MGSYLYDDVENECDYVMGSGGIVWVVIVDFKLKLVMKEVEI